MKPEPDSQEEPTHRSFRDPDGFLVRTQDPILTRYLTPQGMARIQAIEGLDTPRRFMGLGAWIASERSPETPLQVRHPRIFFPSYAHEWCPTMVHRAARLTVAISEALLAEGWELKDATPTNVLFEGPRPVFVDHLSPVERRQGQMGLRAYGQFVRTFLIPILLNARFCIPLKWMYLANRDGIPPVQALPLIPGWRKFRPDVLSLISLPAWLERRANRRERPPSTGTTTSDEVARIVTARILRSFGKRLDRLAAPSDLSGSWQDYQESGTSYTRKDFDLKIAFVKDQFTRFRPSTVLDLGCNTGTHSILAARAGAKVVALDADVPCIERLFIQAEKEGLDILPLVADLGRPSPPMGWAGMEEDSLLDRMEGRFEMTLGLALAHHLIVRERIPLSSLAAFFERTATRHLLLEWVPPSDPQFRSLSGVDHALYADLTEAAFLQTFRPGFRPVESLRLPEGGRSLHLLEACR